MLQVEIWAGANSIQTFPVANVHYYSDSKPLVHSLFTCLFTYLCLCCSEENARLASEKDALHASHEAARREWDVKRGGMERALDAAETELAANRARADEALVSARSARDELDTRCATFETEIEQLRAHLLQHEESADRARSDSLLCADRIRELEDQVASLAAARDACRLRCVYD